MPAIIDYPIVLERMTAGGFRCNYYNSGAFGFPAMPLVRGWIGPPDSTIKADLIPGVRYVKPPYESRLARAAAEIWKTVLPGAAWVMPMSHWHFELHDGSRDWMPASLEEIGVDSKRLENRADGAALEFVLEEAAAFTRFLESLLGNLRVSDFLIAFPGRPALCTVHHHKQLWWMTTDEVLVERVDEIVAI
jgi:hypothetical protein